MKFRVLDDGREITGNHPCSFCSNGIIDVKKALDTFKKEHASLTRMQMKEDWLKKYSEHIEKVKQKKITVYDFYFEHWQLEEEYAKQGFDNVSSSLSEEVACECNKCSKPLYLRLYADIEAHETEVMQNSDLINLPLASEEVLKRVTARMKMFGNFDDFKRWLKGDNLEKATKIIKAAVEQLDLLTEQEEEVARLIGVMKELPEYFEAKLTQRRFDLLQEVKAQLYIDKPAMGQLK